jgi:hypothetical protein
MDLFRKYSPQERDAALKAAREEWDKIPPELSHLVASDEQSFLDSVALAMETEPIHVPLARALTPAETAALDGRLTFAQIYGDRADRNLDNLPDGALKDALKEHERTELEKLLGPARRPESFLESLVREAFEKVVANRSVPIRESDREGIMPRLAARAEQEDANSALAMFLRSYLNHDDAGMRRIARELAAKAT